MPTTWGTRLEKKLTGLADTASKDTIQTISNWIAFNRKHSLLIAGALTSALQESKMDTKKQWIYWKLVHQLLVNEHGNACKWDKLLDLRVALGEALQTTMKELGSSMPEDLAESLQEWDDRNVFGGPSLLSQIKRLYQNRNQQKEEASAENATPTVASSTAKKPLETEASPNGDDDKAQPVSVEQSADGDDDNGDEAMPPAPDDDNDDTDTDPQTEVTNETTKDPLPPPTNASSPSKKNTTLHPQVDYDFESKDIPPGTVEAREFLDPCKAITTLQIARDVRTNTAVEISTALKNLPPDIWKACRDLDSGELKELETATTNDFSIRIPSSLIDLDMEEETSSLNMFQDIVQRQEKAREKLISLLVKSRCEFGSVEAARAFHTVDGLCLSLKRRKELLSDALELEGLDTSQIDASSSTSSKKKHHQELAPLTWYESSNYKKQKIV